MGENLQTNYEGQRYFCPRAEKDNCGEDGEKIINPPELLFLDSLYGTMKAFIANNISRDVEFELFATPESTQLAIVMRPISATNLNGDGQSPFALQFEILCSDSKVALEGGTTFGVAVLCRALHHAKTRLSFQYTYALSFSTTENILVSVSINKRLDYDY